MMHRILTVCALVPCVALADPPDVVEVRAAQTGATWRFDVTVLHSDTGWDHYADGWEVLDANGNRLGFRELLHPHETEQPFTRSLSGVAIPPELDSVQIRARCSVDGWSTETTTVELR
ncbi:hypothetical protein [Flavimaricola marinus]|uniref:Secreted protein n=1 Tax=Flavimaricola marinus TaxID=1819565 RepID=A0A238L9V1_9RHOB|nr:hypothetical protein [Flavimaricola marinus]SMY06194.1 hypothetical protein LOM8899_00316 [Flavimaricola marinus]